MKRNVFRKSMSAAWILLVLLAWGASPSRAYQQDLKKMATELAARIHALNHSRVTVYEFVDLDMKPNKLGKFLAQQLQLALAESETELTVVDQSQMPQLFDQMEKLSEGLIDPATGRQLGKVAGTEVLVVGTVMPSSLTIRLDIKAIDLQTAKLITGKGASLARVGLLGKLANESEGNAETASADDEEETERASTKPVKAKARPPARSRNDQGVLFELDGCSVSGGALTCAVTATSDRDRWLALTHDSRAWNESGDEFGAAETTIANTRSQRGDSCAAKQLLKGVPTALSLTFPQFGDEEWTVERLRLAWYESDDCCCFQERPVDFEKIALSDDANFATSRPSNRPSHGNSVGATTKRKGGLLQRLSGQVLDALEETATKVIDKKTRELTGEDEEDGEEPPRER